MHMGWETKLLEEGGARSGKGRRKDNKQYEHIQNLPLENKLKWSCNYDYGSLDHQLV